MGAGFPALRVKHGSNRIRELRRRLGSAGGRGWVWVWAGHKKTRQHSISASTVPKEAKNYPK
jgi:hypothetical protein